MRNKRGIVSWQVFHRNDGTRIAELIEHSTYWSVDGGPQYATRAEALKAVEELRRRFDNGR